MIISNIVLDIDGTLIDTSDSDKRVFQDIYENASANTGKSMKKLKEELNNTFHYPSYEWFDWNEKLRKIGCTLKFERLNKKYGNLIKVFGDVIPSLERLKSGGNILYAMSDGYEDVQKVRLEATNLIKYFNVLITSDKCRVIKTNKRYFEYMLNLINSKPKEFIIVDDSEYPISLAKRLGMVTVRIDRKNEVGKTGAHYLIRSLKELVNIVK